MGSVRWWLVCWVVVCFVPAAVDAYPEGWSDDILLTPEDNKARIDPDLAVDGFHHVWVVWDSANWPTGEAEVLYAKLDSLGTILIPETPVSNNPEFSKDSRVEVDSFDHVQIIWRDDTPLGVGIWHAKLANDGTFLIPSHIAVSGAGGGGSLLPEMELNKYQEMAIIWDEEPSGYYQMDYSLLDTDGEWIIEKQRVSLPGVNTFWPGCGVDSMATVHMAYRSDSGFSDRLTYTKVTREGAVLIDNQFLGTGFWPIFVIDRSQYIHMVYSDPDGPGRSVEYLKLAQDGTVLIGPLTLSIHESNEPPHMALDSLQYLHVVWQFIEADTNGIMYTKIDTLGNTVIPPMAIVYPPHTPGAGLPRIEVDRSNRLHLIFMDNRLGGQDIYYKRGENDQTVQEYVPRLAGPALRLSIFPNPCAYQTTITVHGAGHSDLVGVVHIYDVTGRQVKSFRITHYAVCNTLQWFGDDDHGQWLPAGVYYIVYKDIHNLVMEKVVILR